MKIHTTNYQNTFITVAEDCKADTGEVPPIKGDQKSVANLQYKMLKDSPYKYTSDDVLFQVYAHRNDLIEDELINARALFFSKGQPCMRCSPLTKRYGWGVHNDQDGKIAIFSRSSKDYVKISSTKPIQVLKAMKSSK